MRRAALEEGKCGEGKAWGGQSLGRAKRGERNQQGGAGCRVFLVRLHRHARGTRGKLQATPQGAQNPVRDLASSVDASRRNVRSSHDLLSSRGRWSSVTHGSIHIHKLPSNQARTGPRQRCWEGLVGGDVMLGVCYCVRTSRGSGGEAGDGSRRRARQWPVLPWWWQKGHAVRSASRDATLPTASAHARVCCSLPSVGFSWRCRRAPAGREPQAREIRSYNSMEGPIRRSAQPHGNEVR